MSTASSLSSAVGDGLHSRYRTPWGGVDEMPDADDGLRPVWRRFPGMLGGLTATDPAARFARASGRCRRL